MIKLKNITCRFSKKTILEDISLDIPSHLSILGANGSGKSTLAKIICNLVDFDGAVVVNDKEIHEYTLKERAKLLSYIPAKLDVYDSFITLDEFVLLGRYAHKNSLLDYSFTDKKIAKECLEFLDIEHLSSNTLHSLSSGETQLALIAQALSQQSKIIIFDEPTANLDPRNSKIIAQHIKSLQEYHQVILITHDIALAAFIGAPVAFVKNKKVSLYAKEFFEKEKLQELYEVNFEKFGVQFA
ncbi:MAG TPA: ABC transporter ATP-binding protein [Sulfurimonas sp.]|nr:ABC transporter ATP-binding protein [Sulfurimonas sp.]HIM76144.1 ABC transporter ATP-binding protein [Campylobacterales bacterium]